jgi:hypothetical protein
MQLRWMADMILLGMRWDAALAGASSWSCRVLRARKLRAGLKESVSGNEGNLTGAKLGAEAVVPGAAPAP